MAAGGHPSEAQRLPFEDLYAEVSGYCRGEGEVASGEW